VSGHKEFIAIHGVLWIDEKARTREKDILINREILLFCGYVLTIAPLYKI